MIIFAFISVRLLIVIVSDDIKTKGLNRTQLLILVLSFFPFIESLQAGQNSGLTLLLMTGLIYFTLKEKLSSGIRWVDDFKPQHILGFLILGCWKNIKSLVGFTSPGLDRPFLSEWTELFRDYRISARSSSFSPF
jgi:hypothetical protein